MDRECRTHGISVYNILFGKHERNRQTDTDRRGLENSVEINVTEIGLEMWTRII